MYQKILIRYGELVLKKKNRKTFINYLANNIKHILGEAPEVEFDRMYVTYSKENLENLKYVFGISSYSPVLVLENNLDKFKQSLNVLLNKNTKTFKIAARRNYKAFEYTSNELNHNLGSYLLKNYDLKVDVHDPDQIFYLEVRQKASYMFSNYIKGLGGLPVGSSGKILHLLSGGFDSPVAAWQLMKRGLKVDCLSFMTPPQTDQLTLDKIHNIVKTLNKYQITSNLIIANYSHLMNYIAFVSKESYKITLMRRSFYRIAEQIALKNKISGISNGENLGQVASQTLESMHVIGSVTTLPILRPLLTFDKNEIIQIAKDINTYQISIIQANETCELFAPKEPVTKPSLAVAKLLEQELNQLPDLEQELIKNSLEYHKYSLKDEN